MISISSHSSRDPPAWAVPALIAITGLASVLVLWSLGANHYANGYYADATLAASRSWRSFILNSADLSNIVSVDKGPLSDWMMGLSGRLFGFGTLSMLVPNALCGIGAVLLLHRLLLRGFGVNAALAGALMLAVTPVSVLMSRFNNPDALLALLLTAAAWALVRAVETGRMRDTLLSGAFVGLAFNTKMIEAYLIVPALGLSLAVAGAGGVRRRIAHLLAAGAVTVAVSMAWFAAMMLVPASGRPYVGDTTDDSWFTLIFSGNGLSRLTGQGSAGGRIAPSHAVSSSASGNFGGPTGPLRLFDHQLAGQIAWLIPLAILGAGLGLWRWRREPRTDLRRATVILLATWAAVGCLIFSLQGGIFHPYYASAVAAPVAALAGLAVVLLSERLSADRLSAALLAAAVLITALLAMIVLGRVPHFMPWLKWVVLAAAGLSVIGLAGLGCLRPPRRSRTLTAAVALAGAVVVLAGPLAYSWATVGRVEVGTNPVAGPATSEPGTATLWHRELAEVRRATLGYLLAHRDGASYLVAGEGVSSVAPYALHDRGVAVITLGGFQGYDPAPSVKRLAALVTQDRLRYVLLTGRDARDPRGGAALPGGARGTRDRWVQRHCRAVTIRHADIRSARLAAAAGRLYSCDEPAPITTRGSATHRPNPRSLRAGLQRPRRTDSGRPGTPVR